MNTPDPMLYSGWLRCPCQSPVWPVDAVWADAVHTLVTYRSNCGCDPYEVTMIVDTLDMEQETQCMATAKTTGRRCQNKARDGRYCVNHQHLAITRRPHQRP